MPQSKNKARNHSRNTRRKNAITPADRDLFWKAISQKGGLRIRF